MVAQPQTAFVTLDDFLAAPEVAEDRAEYVDGVVVAMSGASFEHSVVIQNIAGLLHGQLRGGPCRALAQGIFVKPGRAENVFLPDTAIVCGEPQVVRRNGKDLLLNPTLLIEVLSRSTADYDKGKKWDNYRLIPTLHDYLLVSQDQPRIERYTRHGDRLWLFSETVGLGAEVRIDSVGGTLVLAEVYEGVPFAHGRTEDVG